MSLAKIKKKKKVLTQKKQKNRQLDDKGAGMSSCASDSRSAGTGACATFSVKGAVLSPLMTTAHIIIFFLYSEQV